jgi:multiple sugar transport system substrate-binding protein
MEGRLSRREFISRAAAMGMSLSVVGSILAACGNGGSGNQGNGSSGQVGGNTSTPGTKSGGTQGESASLTWSTWGNPGEMQRFQEYTQDYMKRNPNVKVTLRPIPTDGYEAKILTQLNGGTAPDMFYSGDTTISKLIENNTITELTPMMKLSSSKIKPEDFAEGLWGAAKTQEGKIYGVTVDCNPMVLWYNKKLLQDAGVTQMPADMYEKGTWNRNAFQQMLDQVSAKGKRGFVLDNWWAPRYSWVTTNGGKVYSEPHNGEFVMHEDEKAIDAMTFLSDNLKAKKIIYTGSLPKGQGGDALFLSQQLAFYGAGRWVLPVFKKASSLQFDVVPYPSNTGNKLEPAGVPTAYAVQNAKTKFPDQTYALLSDFVSKEGQTFRLKGGGNAVPSVSGADQVVLEGNTPEHAKYWIDLRKVGYALWPSEAGVPGLGDDINKGFDTLFLKGGDVKTGLQKIGQQANQKIQKAGQGAKG